DAANPEGSGYPRAFASYANGGDSPWQAVDGRIFYDDIPHSRWTNYRSPNAEDHVGVDFGVPTPVSDVRFHVYDDGGGVQTPAGGGGAAGGRRGGARRGRAGRGGGGAARRAARARRPRGRGAPPPPAGRPGGGRRSPPRRGGGGGGGGARAGGVGPVEGLGRK